MLIFGSQPFLGKPSNDYSLELAGFRAWTCKRVDEVIFTGSSWSVLTASASPNGDGTRSVISLYFLSTSLPISPLPFFTCFFFFPSSHLVSINLICVPLKATDGWGRPGHKVSALAFQRSDSSLRVFLSSSLIVSTTPKRPVPLIGPSSHSFPTGLILLRLGVWTDLLWCERSLGHDSVNVQQGPWQGAEGNVGFELEIRVHLLFLLCSDCSLPGPV